MLQRNKWAAAWLKTSLVANVHQRDSFFIVTTPSSSIRMMQEDQTCGTWRCSETQPSISRGSGSILVHVEVQAVNRGVRRGDRLLVCGNLMESVVDVCGCLFFPLLFLSAADHLSFHLSSRAHAHSAHSDIPFGVYVAPETRWCTSPVTLFSKCVIYSPPTHTEERDIKHIKGCTQGLFLYVQRCSSVARRIASIVFS